MLIYNGFPNLTLFYLVVSHLPWFFVWLIFVKIVLIFLTQKQSSFPGEMSQLRYISAMDNGSGVFNYQEGESDSDAEFVPFTQLTPSQQRVTQDPRLYHCTRGEQERAFERYVCLCDKNDV